MNKFPVILIAIFISSLLIFALTGREIIEKSDSNPKPLSTKSRVKMIIYRNGKIKGKKEFELISKKINGNDRMLIKFIRPTRIKLLTHSSKGKDDRQWIKTRSGKPKRIVSQNRGKSFVHSHIFYEDLQTRDINKYRYRSLGTAKAVGFDCYKVEAVKIKGDKIYDKTVLYVRETDNFIVRIDLYKNNRLLKYFENYKIKNIKGIITPLKSVMYLANGKGKTILEIISIKYNIKLTNSLFNKSAL